MRTPITPLYAEHLGAPLELIGLLVAAVTIVGIIVKLPAGALSDLFGFRRLMMIGALVKATGPFLYLLALSWPVLLVVRFYHGLATAIYAPPASALVAKAYPKERGYRLGIYNGAENAGVVLGPVLGGGVLAMTAANFDLAFIISGVIGILALLAMLGVPKDRTTNPPAAPDSEKRRELGEALRKLGVGVREIVADPQIRLVSLVEAMLWVGIGSVQAYLRFMPSLSICRLGRSACSLALRASPPSGAGRSWAGARIVSAPASRSSSSGRCSVSQR